MWRILTIVSSLILAISAWIGLLNKNKLQDERVSLQENTEKLALTNQRIEREEGLLNEAKSIREDNEAKTAKHKADKEALDSQNQEMSTEIASATQKITDTETKLSEIAAQLDGRPDMEALAENIQSMTREQTVLTQDIADLEAKLAQVENRKGVLETQITAAEEREADIRNHVSPASLKASIVTVQNALGFVVINSGANKGVVTGSRLAVMRGTDKIGELVVSAVERTTSIGDIVPGTVSAGRALMPGDSVIAVRTAPAPAKAPVAAPSAQTPVQQDDDDFGGIEIDVDTDTPADTPSDDLFGDDPGEAAEIADDASGLDIQEPAPAIDNEPAQSEDSDDL